MRTISRLTVRWCEITIKPWFGWRRPFRYAIPKSRSLLWNQSLIACVLPHASRVYYVRWDSTRRTHDPRTYADRSLVPLGSPKGNALTPAGRRLGTPFPWRKWWRRGESNCGALLKTIKLLKIRDAQFAKLRGMYMKRTDRTSVTPRSRPDLLRLLNHKQVKKIPYLMLVSSMVE